MESSGESPHLTFEISNLPRSLGTVYMIRTRIQGWLGWWLSNTNQVILSEVWLPGRVRVQSYTVRSPDDSFEGHPGYVIWLLSSRWHQRHLWGKQSGTRGSNSFSPFTPRMCSRAKKCYSQRSHTGNCSDTHSGNIPLRKVSHKSHYSGNGVSVAE